MCSEHPRHICGSPGMQPSLHRSSFLLVPRCDGSPSFIVRKVSNRGPALRIFEAFDPCLSLASSILACFPPIHWYLLYALRYSPGSAVSFILDQWIFFSLIEMQVFRFLDEIYDLKRGKFHRFFNASMDVEEGEGRIHEKKGGIDTRLRVIFPRGALGPLGEGSVRRRRSGCFFSTRGLGARTRDVGPCSHLLSSHSPTGFDFFRNGWGCRLRGMQG